MKTQKKVKQQKRFSNMNARTGKKVHVHKLYSPEEWRKVKLEEKIEGK